jgi:hypothetical protein
MTTPSGKHVEPVYNLLKSNGYETSFTVYPDSHNLPKSRTTVTKKIFDLIVGMEQK